MNLKTSSTKSLLNEGVIAENCPSRTGEEWLAILQEKSLALGKPIGWNDIKQDPELNHKEILEKLGTYSVFERKLRVSQNNSAEQNHSAEKALDFHLEPSMVPKKEKVRVVKKISRKQVARLDKSDAGVNSADENKAEIKEEAKEVCTNEVEVKDDPVVESPKVERETTTDAVEVKNECVAELRNADSQHCDDPMEEDIKRRVEATLNPPTERVIAEQVPEDPVIGVDSNILSQTAIAETLDQKKALELVKLLEESAAEEMKAIEQFANIRVSAWRNAPKCKKTVKVVSFEANEVYFLEERLVVIPKPSASRRCKIAPDDILCMFVSSGIMDGGREAYFSCIRMCKKLETGGWEVTADDLEGYVRLSSTMKEFWDAKSILPILCGGDPWRVIKRVIITKAKQVICEISNRNGEVIGYVYMQALKPAVFKDECLTLYFCLFEIDLSESNSSSNFPMSTDCLIYQQQYSRDRGLQIMVQQTVSFSM